MARLQHRPSDSRTIDTPAEATMSTSSSDTTNDVTAEDDGSGISSSFSSMAIPMTSREIDNQESSGTSCSPISMQSMAIPSDLNDLGSHQHPTSFSLFPKLPLEEVHLPSRLPKTQASSIAMPAPWPQYGVVPCAASPRRQR